ncbi:MAG TPA: hypothetical protein VGQ42_15700 [Candidatus Dormibacteraeota bacterium]|nr:hypothetical protein [Candidatus Dormibacteraeota bacterium]
MADYEAAVTRVPNAHAAFAAAFVAPPPAIPVNTVNATNVADCRPQTTSITVTERRASRAADGSISDLSLAVTVTPDPNHNAAVNADRVRGLVQSQLDKYTGGQP